MKNVLLIIIDALASEVVDRAFAQSQLPNLQRLAELGERRDSCAVFPSITPAATAALATGAYPREHGIAGAFWIDEVAEDVAYYGDDLWIVLEEGLDSFLNDFLVTLNHERLSSSVVFEVLEERGIDAACLNYLWFRGGYEHTVREPWILKLIPGVTLENAIRGPKWLQLGDFVTGTPPFDDLREGSGMFNRFGFNDERTAESLKKLVDFGLPPFTLAYFPDNDFASHDRGPHEAVDVLERIDTMLGELFEARGGVERFLRETTIVVTGDHSQTELIEDEPERSIELRDVLAELRVGKPGAYWAEDDEVLVCPNLRAAQVYCRDRRTEIVDRTVNALLTDPRIDQVLLAPVDDDGWFDVRTADRGRLRFRPSSDGSHPVDAQGNRWEWEGAAATLDLQEQDGRLEFGLYPNAFERIANGFAPRSAGLWATAREGYEFRVAGSSVHAAGSHGSLHRGDSTSPLIVAGHDDATAIPDAPRSIDVMPLCVTLLGLD